MQHSKTGCLTTLLCKEGAADSLISHIKFTLAANRLYFMLNAEMAHHVLAAGTQLCDFLFLCLRLQVEADEVTKSYQKNENHCFQTGTEWYLWYFTMAEKKPKLTQQQGAGVYYFYQDLAHIVKHLPRRY